ncbi:uncharacterized protein CEXT_278121 [Caerostris extrusa]|uniref:Uncharacterized protein n=1 Tax=Caerostris extrusa TaxID=172846 RepID=A0AAV4Q9C1_CAEEX|nr:uncharacterized protein CEXT_278121 [Caerostris extrusa]
MSPKCTRVYYRVFLDSSTASQAALWPSLRMSGPQDPPLCNNKKKNRQKEAKAKPGKKTKEVEIGAKFALMKEETPKFVTDTELIENENDVVTNLISDYLEKVIERFDDLIGLSISLHTIESRISFVQEYIDRLNMVRLKQVPEPEDESLIVEELDQLEIIFETQRKEGDFLKVLLDYFVKRGKDDFLINTVF